MDVSSEIKISFNPVKQQIDEIKLWLMDEDETTGEGFYCNWRIISAAFEENLLAVISCGFETVGFVIWSVFAIYTATIDIMEVKPNFRNKGFGKKLTIDLLFFLKKRGILVVDLQCAPPSSEDVWRRLGFIDFPKSWEQRGHSSSDNKQLYRVLIPLLSPITDPIDGEVLELWNNEPYQTKDSMPSWQWVPEFKKGTRVLKKAIIFPCHQDWRIRWRVKDAIIRDDKIKYFRNQEIGYGKFIVIKSLPKDSL